jgi:hypothetical protein
MRPTPSRSIGQTLWEESLWVECLRQLLMRRRFGDSARVGSKSVPQIMFCFFKIMCPLTWCKELQPAPSTHRKDRNFPFVSKHPETLFVGHGWQLDIDFRQQRTMSDTSRVLAVLQHCFGYIAVRFCFQRNIVRIWSQLLGFPVPLRFASARGKFRILAEEWQQRGSD